MNHGKMVLALVLEGLHPESFRRCLQRWPMPRETPSLSAYDQFAAMVFAQLTYRESLRDIEGCLASRRRVLNHAGIRGPIKRCNLAYANEHRDWRLVADVAAASMRQARRLYQDRPAELDLDGDLFALDATVIELSLKLFPWGRWQRAQASVKLDVLLDLRGDIPVFANIFEGNRHEVASLDEIPVYPGSFYTFDRVIWITCACIVCTRPELSSSHGSRPTRATTLPTRARSTRRMDCAATKRSDSIRPKVAGAIRKPCGASATSIQNAARPSYSSATSSTSTL
jgi:hypothetical protein